MSHLDFEALKQLHNTANNLLHSPVIKQSLVSYQQEKHVYEVSEASLSMLGACGNTKDVLLLVRDHLQELQSTFRRISIGETAATGSKLSGFYIHRKKLRKELLNCLRASKGMKNNDIMNSDLYSIDHNLGVVVNVLREVRATNVSIVESLMSLMSMPGPVCKSNRGSFKSKFMRVNSLSVWENCDMKTFQTGNRILEAVETAIEDLGVELDCIFRRLIRTRVSLLNIFTT